MNNGKNKDVELVKIITFSGASGSGKTIIVKYLLETSSKLKLLTSITTRQPRNTDLPNEYHCVTPEEFKKIEEEQRFIWTISIHGYSYGTLFESINEDLKPPFCSLMILTPEAVSLLLRYVPGQVLPFYILSPLGNILRRRLQNRGENEYTINQRLNDCCAWDEGAKGSEVPYLFITNNGTIQETISEILCILKREIGF